MGRGRVVSGFRGDGEVERGRDALKGGKVGAAAYVCLAPFRERAEEDGVVGGGVGARWECARSVEFRRRERLGARGGGEKEAAELGA